MSRFHACRSGCQLGLGLFDYRVKSGLVIYGQISQDFAINVHIGFLQTGDKLAIGDASSTGTGIDTGDPQRAKYPLFVTAITIGILPGFGDGLGRYAINPTTGTVIAFGLLENFFVTTIGNNAAFYSSHFLSPDFELIFTQHALYCRHVAGMYSAGTAKLALTLGGHLGQDVALVGALALEAGTGFLEPFRGTTMGFQFRTHLQNSAFIPFRDL
jgi:hypothetical protein